MATAIIIEKESFDALLDKVDNLSREILALKKEVRQRDTKLYNITEAAKLMKISTPTLHKLINNGLIETKLVGNSTYFTMELIDKFLSQK